MRENRTSGSMRRGERRVMVHSANGHRTRKGGNSGAPPDLDTTALALHSTERDAGRTGDTANGAPHGAERPLMSRRGWNTRRPPDGLIHLTPAGASTVGLFAVAGPVRRERSGAFMNNAG
jgi:hypothetical protein